MKNRQSARFKQLVESYYHIILDYIDTKLNNRADAEELTQDVFIKIFNYGVNKIQNGKEKAFLFKAAKNIIRDYYKHNSRKKRLNTIPLEEAYKVPNPDASHEENEQVSRLLKKLYRRGYLTKKDIEVLTPWLEGYDFKEIAAMIGITESTASKKCQRARDKLKSKKDEVVTYIRS